MALELDSRYPGRFNPGDADYPQGSFKNRTAPGALDGSYLEKDWANDKEGFFQRLMAQAGLTPNGNVDTALVSQYYDALVQVISDNAPPPPVQSLPLGYFSGFTLANNSGAPNTTIDVGTGTARSSDNTVDITLTGTLRGILQSSGSWAAGDNQNKLLVGARANNTWYHVFSIRKTSDGTADIAMHPSTNPSADMPSGYAGFVLIESIRTDSSGNILGFVNAGRTMTWKTARQDVALDSPAPGNSTVTISTPPGRRVMAKQYAAVNGDGCTIYTHSPDVNNETLSPVGVAWRAGISTNNPGLTTENIAGYLECVTGTTSNVVMQTYSSSATLNVVQLATMGWEKI